MPVRPGQNPATVWRKSRATADSGTCVEVAVQKPFVLVRDSNNRNDVELSFGFAQWLDLIERIRKGTLGSG
jgi:Domain of unknown function (DUF397)